MYGPLKLCGEVVVDAPAAACQKPFLMRTETVVELFWYQNSVVLKYNTDSPNVFNITDMRNVSHYYMTISKIAGGIAWQRLHAPQHHGSCKNGEKNQKVSMILSMGACSKRSVERSCVPSSPQDAKLSLKTIITWLPKYELEAKVREIQRLHTVKSCRPTKLWPKHNDRPNWTASVELNPAESESCDTEFVQRYASIFKEEWIKPTITHSSWFHINTGMIHTYWRFECAHPAKTKAAAPMF